MKETGKFSRKQFLKGGLSVLTASVLGRLSTQSYADWKEEKPEDMPEAPWEELPLDILNDAGLVSDTHSQAFGMAQASPGGCLTQYVPVWPGLSFLLSGTKNGIWVGYSRTFEPIALPRHEKAQVLTIPQEVYYLRGCDKNACPRIWTQSPALYALRCDPGRPSLSGFTEITEPTIHAQTRTDQNGDLAKTTMSGPALGDVFFTPIGTEIILSFENANIAPTLHGGSNYDTQERTIFLQRHYELGRAWFSYRTRDVCNWVGTRFEASGGYIRPLTGAELAAARPRIYIRFPSTATGTQYAARARTEGVSVRWKRLFTVVHLTDTHGDADSTHAALVYADSIGADFAALTGDYVPTQWSHGYDILHTLIREAKTPVVFSLGNHDVSKVGSDKKVYDSCIAPIRDTLRAAENHAYYYRDFRYEGETVRAISLYPFYDQAESRSYGYYTQEQLLWLCETMATAPDNSHIFILRHFTHHRPVLADGDKTMFYDYDGTDVSNPWLSMGEDPVKDVVDAFNSRTLLSVQYSGYLKDDGQETVNLQYDFTQRTNAEFVAYFTGHSHADHVGCYRDAKTRQIVLGSLCTTGVRGTETYAAYIKLESQRDYGTDSQIALNVFTFDFEKKKIYVARVGNGFYQDREKTMMELSYR